MWDTLRMRKLAKIRKTVNEMLIPTGFQIERSRDYLPFNKRVSKKMLTYPTQQKLTNDFLIRFADECDFLIDVGANRGTFSDHFFHVAGPIPSIFIEPIPALADALKEKYRDKKNSAVYQCAISSSIGKNKFHITSNDGQSSSLLNIGRRHLAAAPNAMEVDEIEVNVETLNNLCAQYDFRSAFLKIDVQGNELKALEGAAEILPRVNAIHIEVSIQSLYEGDSIGFRIWEFLNQYNYVVYGIDPWFRDSKANGELLQADFFFIKENLRSDF